MKRWIRIALVIFGTLAMSASIWFAGPLIGFGDARPFESWIARAVLIGLLVLAVALVFAVRFWRRRRAEKALEATITAPDARGGRWPGARRADHQGARGPEGRRQRLHPAGGSALVRDHRPAGHRQDHRARQFRAEVRGSGRRSDPGPRRRRRHALLRLVVLRERGADRYRRTLHHPGFGCPRRTRRAGSPSSSSRRSTVRANR